MQTPAKDFTITLGDNRPGALATAFEALSGSGININGYAEIEGTLHLLTADASSARKALETAGLTVAREADVAVAEVTDRPGVAARIFRQIADAKVNVDFSYVATNNRIVVGASDVAKVKEILAQQAAKVG